jgi:hypothetical protein
LSRVEHVTRGTVGQAPPPCQGCMWWQTRSGGREPEAERWREEVEEEFGPWGKLYLDGGHVVGYLQYGPAARFPRAQTMPAGPPSRDAVVVTCAYLTDAQSPWALQSLLLAAIGECRDRGLPALEAFAYQYEPGEPFAGRFMTHRTIFSKDFLSDFGFTTLRSAGRIELMRLDLRGIQVVPDGGRLARLRARLAPAQPLVTGLT